MVNMSLYLGTRLRGAIGALTAVLGLIGLPILVVITLATVLARFDSLRSLHLVLDGIADQTDRRIDIIVSKAHKPEQVRRIRVSRAIRKQLLVNRASVIQPASAMQLERPIQQRGIG